mmetsp:Transcript_32723/g.48457  ORF Transcript_32723/g.48457 Transcript_32723/m.48457 type:complete len:344 (+) Transcript_32723:99-1130(+)|eukprot:CAMPEP_0194216008 /NCGR_PEP_ID=MMETSP0156-20130528/18210_1 /TAXON_ID=33649 /ORGANISM="Thalassionema nitzschioides, Strain L26-B" /LENGTH=343 /DNA_ID=CAMNT_0038944673 /DNA_START=89 /DNA_END=1120 /DNA_ORIENTATION=+
MKRFSLEWKKVAPLGKPNATTFALFVLTALTLLAHLPISFFDTHRNLNIAPRPRIFTYFEDYKTDPKSEAFYGDKTLIAYWQAAWKDAGWEPIVLNEKVAEAHPDYEVLKSILTDEECVGEYDMACVKRWIAMANVGGGYMSDNDFFPIVSNNHMPRELANGGNLTVYGIFVPALVSGTANEYRRVAEEILKIMEEYTEAHRNGETRFANKCGSDMLSLSEMYKKNQIVGVQKSNQCVKDLEISNNYVWTPEECRLCKEAWGAHISHSTMKQNNIPIRLRGPVAYGFVDSYKKQCVKEQISLDYGQMQKKQRLEMMLQLKEQASKPRTLELVENSFMETSKEK